MSPVSKQQIRQAIELAGNQGRYQKCMIILFSLMWIEISLFLIGPSYIYMNPNFKCPDANASKVLQNTACSMLNQCTLIDHFTITSDLHLYCDQKFIRSFIQIIFSVGAFAGLLIINLISDIKTRKYAAILALVIANLGSVGTFLGGSYERVQMLIVSQFLSGFGAYALIPLAYTYFADFCSDKYRQRGVVFVNSGWYDMINIRGLSTILLGVLYILETHWSVYLLYFLVFPFFVVSVTLSFFLIESPYVLVLRGKQKKALETLLKLCRFNKRHQKITQIQRMFYQYDNPNENEPNSYPTQQSPSVGKMFRTLVDGGYIKSLSILMVICSISTLHLYGVAFAMELEGLGYGVNSIVAGVIIFTSFLYLNYIIHKIPRKWGMVVSFTILALLGLLFLVPKIKGNLILTTLVLGVSRVASNIAYTLLACIQTQAFTVEIQSIAAALIQTFSVLGVLFGPLAVNLSENIQMDPIVFISIILNFAIWPSFFISQTVDKTKAKSSQKIKAQHSFHKQDKRSISNI